MSLPRTIATLIFAALASVCVSLALRTASDGLAQDSAGSAGEPGELVVEWAYRPTDLADLAAESPALLYLEVTGVRQGPAEASPSDVSAEAIPTQRIDVRVLRDFRGQAPSRLTLYKLGGPGVQPEGDPAYSVGERYLVFARRRLTADETAPNPDGTWIATAPDGRMRELGSGRLQALIEGGVTERLNGATVSEAAAEAENARVEATR